MSSDGRGIFSLFITPPDADAVRMPFKKNVVFLLDRSGSMGGQPYKQACAAVCYGIDSLRPEDSFSVILFNQTCLTPPTSPGLATPAYKETVKRWLYGPTNGPNGGTNIMSPLESAKQVLFNFPDQSAVPMVILVTDGMVADERQILQFVETQMLNIRVSCFGIGPYCNAAFLKVVHNDML